MYYPNCPTHILPKLPIPPYIEKGPSLQMTVSESDVCGNKVFMTFIDDEFLGVYVEKNDEEVFSYLRDADSIQLSRKAS